jgi:hypothetical protein
MNEEGIMSEFIAVIGLAAVPLALVFILYLGAVAVFDLVVLAVGKLKAKRLSLQVSKYNESFEDNHRQGVDRRQSTERRVYPEDKRQEVFS